VAGVRAQADDAQLRPVAAVALEEDRRRVPAAVVHGDHLVGFGQRVEDRAQPLDEEVDDGGLVVHRHDDRQLEAAVTRVFAVLGARRRRPRRVLADGPGARRVEGRHATKA
jgi:hypothetical protein